MDKKVVLFRSDNPDALLTIPAVWAMQNSLGVARSSFKVRASKPIDIVPRTYEGETALRAALVNLGVSFIEMDAATVLDQPDLVYTK